MEYGVIELIIAIFHLVKPTTIPFVCDWNKMFHFARGHTKLAFVCVSHSICATYRSIVELWEQMYLTIIYTLTSNI